MEKAKRLTVRQAAKILGMGEHTVRTAMKQGVLPIGFVTESEGGFSYYIYEEKIEAYLGKNFDTPLVLQKILDYVNSLKREYDDDT